MTTWLHVSCWTKVKKWWRIPSSHHFFEFDLPILDWNEKKCSNGVSSKVINLDGVWCVPNVGLGCPLSGQSAITSVTVLDRWFLTFGQIWLFHTTYKNQTERSSSEIFRLFLPTFLEFFDIDHLIVTYVIILFQKRPSIGSPWPIFPIGNGKRYFSDFQILLVIVSVIVVSV